MLVSKERQRTDEQNDKRREVIKELV